MTTGLQGDDDVIVCTKFRGSSPIKDGVFLWEETGSV